MLGIRGFVNFAVRQPEVGNCDFIGLRKYVQRADFEVYRAD